MPTPTISIICCHTGLDKLAYLADSLDQQTVGCERLFVDNSRGSFSSCAAALNYGAMRASGDFLLFAHQDIRFKDPEALADLIKACEMLGDGDIGGVAGAIVVDGKKRTKTNITHSADEIPYAEIDHFETVYVSVESIDECLIIMRRSTWEQHPFDEVLCDSWHCYGVEQSLYARRHGHRVLVFDARVNHLSSTGTFDDTFYHSLMRLARHYRGSYDRIVATTGIWPCRGLWLTIAENRAYALYEKTIKPHLVH